MNFSLTPVSASVIFLALIFFGRAFRQNWKAQTEGWVWRSWAYGIPAATSFFILALIPLYE
jgi:hypothetical protein